MNLGEWVGSYSPSLMEKEMQYWLNKITNRMERLEDELLEKHPEKLEYLKRHSYIRVISENNHQPYKKSSRAASIKKSVKKVTKRITKKKK